jgi:MarR family 2-MHQ and catechol resistance regulon transcriptional repressor
VRVSIAVVRVPDDVELADSLEGLFQRIGCSQAESDLHSMVDAELSVLQFRCLLTLAQCGQPIPINELAERLGLTLATAGRNIDRLVAQDLVLRREDPNDRRVRRVSLAPRGIQMVTGLGESHRNGLLSFIRSLAAPDRARLHAALLPIISLTSTPTSLEEQSA